jgi:ABC-2 type transport system permease protein
MPTSKTLLIARREYLSRVKTAGFWISTIALPLLMAAWMILPSLIMAKTRGGLRLAVVDTTGTVAPRLEARVEELAGKPGERRVDLDLEVVAPATDRAAQRAELDRRVLGDGEDSLDAWLWISGEGLADDTVEYHGRTVSNFVTLEVLERMVSRIVREQRLGEAGLDGDEVARLTANVDLATIRVTEAGGEADAGLGDLALAVGLFVILYMTIIIYGNMVLQGVLEEKGNRVVEVMISTVRPFELMAGKLVGIGAVSLSQLAIWLGSAAVLTAPGLVSAFVAMPAEVKLPQLHPAVIGHFLALFLLGYVLYASFYALIGAAFNNPQEAQQLASFGVIFLIVPWLFFMPVLNDPDSTLAVVTSLIPLFTPLMMMLRIAVKMPPAWEIALGYALTIAFDVVMIWICARVYRVGILMYGKKPTLREIARWVRYS